MCQFSWISPIHLARSENTVSPLRCNHSVKSNCRTDNNSTVISMPHRESRSNARNPENLHILPTASITRRNWKIILRLDKMITRQALYIKHKTLRPGTPQLPPHHCVFVSKPAVCDVWSCITELMSPRWVSLSLPCQPPLPNLHLLPEHDHMTTGERRLSVQSGPLSLSVEPPTLCVVYTSSSVKIQYTTLIKYEFICSL